MINHLADINCLFVAHGHSNNRINTVFVVRVSELQIFPCFKGDSLYCDSEMKGLALSRSQIKE